MPAPSSTCCKNVTYRLTTVDGISEQTTLAGLSNARWSCRSLTRIGGNDAKEGRKPQQIGQTGDLDDRSETEIGGDDRRGCSADHRKAAVDAPSPDEHVILANAPELGHCGRHREAHQKCGRGNEQEAEHSTRPNG